jgi:acyl-CoA thioesterase-1
VNDLVVYHVGSGHAFFSGIALIQLAGLSAFLKRRRWLAICQTVSACAGVILVAVSSTPLPFWLYCVAGAVTLAWIVVEGRAQTTHRRLGLGLRYAMLAAGWLGIALEVPFHLMPAIPRVQNPQVFLVGDSLSAGIGGSAVPETWPKVLSRSHHIVLHDLSRSGADVATAMRQAEQVSEPNSLVLVEIGGNDVLRPTSPDAFEQALEVLLAKLRDARRTIIMFELPLPPFHNRYGEAQRRLARRHGALLVPKHVLMGILTSKGATLDTVHLSGRGHELMADTVWDIIGQSIGP